MSEEAPSASRTAAPAREERSLITGATGFIGGRLAERLAGEGHRLRCLVRASSDTTKLKELGVEIVLGDLSDRPSLQAAAEGCRNVLHCAALVSDWATTEEITRANVLGTRNLLEACLAASAERFVHFSTTDVYGHPGTASIGEDRLSGRFSNWYA